MANTYTWSIKSLECAPSLNGQTDVVSAVHWSYVGTDGANYAYLHGIEPLSYAEGSPFTSYTNLNDAVVIGWLEAAFSKEQIATMQKLLDNQIANLAKSTTVTLPLPWGSV